MGAFTLHRVPDRLVHHQAALGIRVTQEEEVEGLDIGEHGNEAYPNFQPVAERQF